MMSILDEIFANKRDEVARQKREKPLAEVQAEAGDVPPPVNFIAGLRGYGRGGEPGSAEPQAALRRRSPALIAEVKRASPSRGILSPNFNPLRLAQIYRESGAAAISVLTDEHYFQGSLAYLEEIAAGQLARPAGRLPLLRKDFLFDPYQLYQSRAAGADAVLLIAAALTPSLLGELHGLALSLGMAALVEVHTLKELEGAMACRPALVGINNRDLHTFSTSLETTLLLRPHLPSAVTVVAESGIHTQADVACLAAAGVDAVLVGEALVTARDVAAKVRSLANVR